MYMYSTNQNKHTYIHTYTCTYTHTCMYMYLWHMQKKLTTCYPGTVGKLEKYKNKIFLYGTVPGTSGTGTSTCKVCVIYFLLYSEFDSIEILCPFKFIIGHPPSLLFDVCHYSTRYPGTCMYSVTSHCYFLC